MTFRSRKRLVGGSLCARGCRGRGFLLPEEEKRGRVRSIRLSLPGARDIWPVPDFGEGYGEGWSFLAPSGQLLSRLKLLETSSEGAAGGAC